MRVVFLGVQQNQGLEKSVAHFEMNLSNILEIEPLKKQNNYPEGWNVSNWFHSKANDPAGVIDAIHGLSSRRQGENPLIKRFPSFKRYENRIYTIGVRYAELTQRVASDIDGLYNDGGNPMAIVFNITKDQIYKRNISIPLRQYVYYMNEGKFHRCTIRYVINPNSIINFSIDRIRPTFPTAPADQFIKIDEPLAIGLSARDLNEQGQELPQSLTTDAPTNPREVTPEHIDEGVFTSVVGVKKIITLAGGNTIEEDYGTNLPQGLYINQATQQIEGTPEEEGTFRISMTTADAAGNGQRQGRGTPQNWTSNPVTFTLTITPRMGRVNPSLRMRVAQ